MAGFAGTLHLHIASILTIFNTLGNAFVLIASTVEHVTDKFCKDRFDWYSLSPFSTKLSMFHTHILSLQDRMKGLTLHISGFVFVLCAALCTQCELSVVTTDGCLLVGLWAWQSTSPLLLCLSHSTSLSLSFPVVTVSLSVCLPCFLHLCLFITL